MPLYNHRLRPTRQMTGRFIPALLLTTKLTVEKVQNILESSQLRSH